jgi:hypothetical protein
VQQREGRWPRVIILTIIQDAVIIIIWINIINKTISVCVLIIVIIVIIFFTVIIVIVI